MENKEIVINGKTYPLWSQFVEKQNSECKKCKTLREERLKTGYLFLETYKFKIKP